MSESTSAAAAAAHPYRRWQIRIFAATWLAYAGYYFCRQPFGIVKATLGSSLGLDAVHLAHIWTAYLVAYMVGQFSSAYFGRVLGPKLLLLTGIAISIGSCAAFGTTNGFGPMLTFMCLNGLAQGTGWPGCIGSLAFWFTRRQRGSVLGAWATCYQFGAVAAKSYAAFLLGKAGWRWSFYGGSLVLLAVWAIVLFLHPNRPESVGLAPLEDEDEPEGKAPAAGGGNTGMKGLGWTRDVFFTVFTMGTIYFCIKFLRYALWSWAAYFLSLNFQMGKAQAGYVSTIFDWGGMFGVVFAGFASDRLFKGKRAFLALVLLFGMTLSFGLMYGLGSTSVAMFAVSMGLAGFMLYGPDSLISGVGAIDVGSKRGALVAAGIINGMGSIGPIFQEELIGWMYKRGGGSLLPIFLLLVVVACAGTFVTFLLWLRSRKGKATI